MNAALEKLSQTINGTVQLDPLSKALYATDASVYRKIPLGVAFPKDLNDLQRIIQFCNDHSVGLIPRTAGTSLAGQCVGDGLVVDVSKHFTEIISLDLEKKQVTVQPGVIRDELNDYLAPHGLFFGPKYLYCKSLYDRWHGWKQLFCTTSIKYGVTREKIVSMKAVLWDGSTAEFKDLSSDAFKDKMLEASAEGQIYKGIYNLFVALRDSISNYRRFSKKRNTQKEYWLCN